MPIRTFRVSGFLPSLLIAGFFAVLPVPLQAQSVANEATPSPEQKDAREALSEGVAAFKNARFDEAVRLFERAKQLDPSLENAGLYLATAYASQYIPGAPSEENRQTGDLAVREYKEVLARNPASLSAIDGLASILYQMAGQPFSAEMFEESKSYHKKHIQLKPDDPQPYYSVGVIDWALSYHANTVMRAEFNQSVGVHPEQAEYDQDSEGGESQKAPARPTGLKDSDPLPEFLRRKYAEEYGPTIDEGIRALKRAIELDPNHDDAMVYLNLLYRRNADVAATASGRNAYIEEADELLDKVKDIKLKKASEPQP